MNWVGFAATGDNREHVCFSEASGLQLDVE